MSECSKADALFILFILGVSAAVLSNPADIIYTRVCALPASQLGAFAHAQNIFSEVCALFYRFMCVCVYGNLLIFVYVCNICVSVRVSAHVMLVNASR